MTESAPPAPEAAEFNPITSQDDFDRAIGQRLAQERSKFADYDEIKSKASKLDELETANQSEIEKLTSALSERDKSAADLGSAVQSTRVENAVLRQASAKNIIDPDAAARLLDPKTIEFDDDGHPTNVDKLLDELLEKRPYLAGTKKPAVPARPKPGGKTVDNGDESPNTEGKQRAVDAVRAFRRS